MKRSETRVAPLRRALRALDTPPEPRWYSLVVHHGTRVLLLVATAIGVYLCFPAPRIPDAAVLEQGVVAPQDVIAEFDFPIPKSESALLRDQAEAASGVPPVFDYLPTAQDSVLAGVGSFFSSADSIRRANPDEAERREAIRDFVEQNRLSPTAGTLALLLDPARSAQLRQSIEEAVRDRYPDGVLPSALEREGFSAARIRNAEGEELIARDSLLSPDRFFSVAAESLLDDAGPTAAELQRLVLIRFFQPSLAFNQVETEAARQRARDAVDPVKATVLEGELIVSARQQIGEEEEERLRAYQAALTGAGMAPGETGQGWERTMGSVLYNAFVLSILGVLLWLFRRPLYHDFRSVVLFTALVLTVAGTAALIARLELPAELIPVTFAALIVAVLWDGRLGLLLALLLALLIGGQTPFLGATAPFTIALGGAAAAFSVQIVQRRSRTWLFISIISLAYFVAAITMGMLRSRAAEEVLWSMGWGAANAVVASLLAIGFLPLLEAFTRITTDQTLLELSDLNRKLLKRLSWEASGTYHHTINVANMAEAACHAIGAHGLLARVGAYYHDIGKLVKPQYFIENQPKGRNPHDKLKPAMSAAIIRSHVVEGLKMAEEEKLPGVIRNFIAEHHGTQQISFFYDKAREMDPDGQINPADFSYPGPKPQTKETAVVMMSDSVESAARVLQDPTPPRIRDLVDRIVAGKMASGQLDQSPLTLKEIDTVKEQLVNVVTGMYHHRIDYPPQFTPGAEVPAREQAAASGRAVSAG